MSVDERLATYGTLAPGRPNHHQLSGLRGRWILGTVKGRLVQRGWGAALGYPALIPAEDGDDVEVHVFLSPDLPEHWPRLDAFEGAEYRRATIPVHTREGVLEAWIYLDARPTTG
ncbi:MAG: gamma-glutamylcyclotransferase [Alphaproteobacteria bacterium]|nr:gamma-glutamylcyclotransferase [Alphaproteobacteria bacterium]